VEIGNIIQFNNANWRVLDVREGSVLIITEEVVEKRVYHSKRVPITWAECDMRKYLNGEFYDRFTGDEKSRIITVTNKTPDNPWFGTKGGADTDDNILDFF